MQKVDVYNHVSKFDDWKEGLTSNYIEEGLTKENSKLFVDYFKWLGERKSKGYCNRNRSKMRSVMIGLQNKGINDVTKITFKKLEDYFFEWIKDHSPDYIKRWNAFWSWYAQEKRRQGKVVIDLTLKMKDFQNGKGEESNFVWLTKEEFDKLRTYFDEDKQTIMLFTWDAIIRAPTELLSVKTENIYQKGEEVWIDIPKEISKTIGRKFNLVYSGQAVLDYIKRHDKKQGDYLFQFSPPLLNQEMQKIAKQLWDGKKSEGGEYYKNITLYDFRHSGAIHFRQLFQKTGQSLDLLRERGGWSDLKMINYYTKRLGLTGHISKEKLLLEEDKTKLEKDVEKLKKNDKERYKQVEKLLIFFQKNPDIVDKMIKRDKKSALEIFNKENL
ncbi:MAG: tyrosine-type recombinase/integrase [Candidatus Pacearchaeota archaeon]|nr:tyrosine-type recombinase/integrase [Candidatus Pacearchaeota archaeon]